MESSFDPHAIEQQLYDEWERAGYFAPAGNGKPYCIVIPPPNVTGSLHMGHAFQHTLMDALIRYHRMKGDRALWQMGTDHAGIATQMLVERQLNAEGRSRHEIGRDAFVDRVWQWKAQSGDTISRQLRRMGSSLDWSRDRFTMDEGFSRAVLEVFVRLYDEGLIYRGQRLVNWDPALGTAISDLEVENGEEQGSLWHFRYPLRTAPPRQTAETIWWSPPRVRKPCSATPRWPCTRRTSGTGIWSASGSAAPGGAGTAHHRRRLRRPGVRHRLRQDHPGHDFNDNAVGARHGLPLVNVFASTRPSTTTLRRVTAGSTAMPPATGRRRPGRRRPARQGRGPHPHGAPGRPLRRRHRAVAHRSVVRQDRASGRAGHRRRGKRRHRVRPEAVRKRLLRLDAQHSGLVHLTPAVVGPPNPGLVRRPATSTSAAAKPRSARGTA
jgi:hypothetical protein